MLDEFERPIYPSSVVDGDLAVVASGIEALRLP